MNTFQLTKSIYLKLTQKDEIRNLLQEGHTLQHVLDFSDELMAKGYHVARHLLEEKKTAEARDAFFFLATLNSTIQEYWLGLGMSLQLCQEYEKAIDVYEFAALINLSNPVPYFYLAKCLFAIHDQAAALQALDLTIEIADEAEEYHELSEQARKAKNILLLEQDS